MNWTVYIESWTATDVPKSVDDNARLTLLSIGRKNAWDAIEQAELG